MEKDIYKLTFRDLQLLQLTEKFGSLTRAATTMRMSPSGASRALTHIREILGDSCFVFTRGVPVPTAFFNRIRPVISDILVSTENLKSVYFEPQSCTRMFIVSCLMAEAAHIVGGVLPMMLAEAPNSRLHVSKCDDQYAAVLNGEADFAIVAGVNMPQDVHELRLYPLDRVVLLRKDHPLTKLNRPPKSYDLKLWDRVTVQSGRSVAWTGPEQRLFSYEKQLERSRFTTSRFNLAWEAMEKTDLIAICGFRAAEIAMRQNDLTCLPLPEDLNAESVWISLVWSDVTHHDSDCIWLRRIFAKWVKEEQKRICELIESGKIPKGILPTCFL